MKEAKSQLQENVYAGGRPNDLPSKQRPKWQLLFQNTLDGFQINHDYVLASRVYSRQHSHVINIKSTSFRVLEQMQQGQQQP